MKRKWLSLMLALAMVTSLLSGCGGGNSESGGTGEQSPDAAPSSTVQNTIFNGELEQNITIRVLENDTGVRGARHAVRRRQARLSSPH